MKVVRLNESQLRRLIEAELTQAGGTFGADVGPAAAVKKLMAHLDGARQALIELGSSASDSRVLDQAQALASGVNRIIKAVNSMPGLGAGRSSPPPRAEGRTRR